MGGWRLWLPSLCLAGGLWMVAADPEPPKPGVGDANALRAPVPVQRLKAAILINIARFFTWPAETLGPTDQPFRIGILGTDPFGDHLRQESAAATIQGRPIGLVRAQRPEDLRGCQLVFIAPDRDLSLRDSLAPLARHTILVVGDEPEFAKRGGMVNLRLHGDQISLEICREAVEATGLGFRASLRQVKGIEWIAHPEGR